MSLCRLALLAVVWPLVPVLCCSYFELPYPAVGEHGTAYAIGRTMELGDFSWASYSVEVVPKSCSGGRYSYVAPMNVVNSSFARILKLDNIAFDGMNERGLTVSALAFRESVYEPRQAGKRALKPLRVVPELLQWCDSVESALRFLEKVAVVPQWGILLHWAIADPSGRSVVVEYLQGQRVVSENTPRTLTNDPNLQWHWRNLNSYANLNGGFPHNNDFMQVEAGHGVGAVPRTVGHGWNLHGLPGDFSSPSRFARLFYLKGYALHARRPKDASSAIVLGTGLLNNVFIPFGTVGRESIVDAPEFTAYGMVKLPQERKMLVRGYTDLQWREVDLKRLDLNAPVSWPLEDGTLGVRSMGAGRALSQCPLGSRSLPSSGPSPRDEGEGPHV